MSSKSYLLDSFIRETKWLYNPPVEADTNNVKRQRIAKAIIEIMKKELTQKQLDCFKLVIIEEHSITEAAKILGVNKSTVSRHIARAKDIIQQALKYSFIW